MKLLLILLGLIPLGYITYALKAGKIYCKGGPYLKVQNKGLFWISVFVYLSWSGMFFYFALWG